MGITQDTHIECHLNTNLKIKPNMKKPLSITHKLGILFCDLLNLLCFWRTYDKEKTIMVCHHEVDGKLENGKYSSTITKKIMTMDESVSITVAKF